jgi:Flp pilus assembly protein TadD
MKRDLLIALLLSLLVVTVFWGVWRYPFIGIDDDLYVARNPHVQRMGAGSIRELLFGLSSGHWHPLTWLWQRLGHSVYGSDAGGYHASNLQLHLLNTLLLYCLLRRITRRFWTSALIAALFGIHPLHVEPVVWISSLKDMLSTLFLLLTLVAYSSYAAKGGAWRLAWVTTLFGVGLMAKSMLVTLPFLMVLVDFWPLERLQAAPTRQRFLPLWRALREKAPLFLLSGLAIVMAVLALRAIGLASSLDKLPWMTRLSYVPINYAVYLAQTFWPTGLMPLYRHPWSAPAASDVVVSLAVLLVISAWTWRLRKTLPALLMCWLWFLIALLPVVGFLQFGAHIRADRYTYVPHIGLFTAIATGLAYVADRWRRTRVLLIAVALLAVVALSITTRAQVRHWTNNLTLGQHMLDVDPKHEGAEILLGLGLAAEGRHEQALAHYERAARLRPTLLIPDVNRGASLLALGRYNEAIEVYSRVIRLEPECVQAEIGLANALALTGQLDKALSHYLRAIEINPNQSLTHYNIGVFYERLGQPEQALAYYANSIDLAPSWAPPRDAAKRLLARRSAGAPARR